MFKTKIIYKLFAVFLLFALMIVLPFSYTVVKLAHNMITEDEAVSVTPEKEMIIHMEFIPKLFDHIFTYSFYILVLAFLFSVFFSRKILKSLKELQKGALALRDGELDIKLDIVSDDEFGDVIKKFNEMAAALNKTTLELSRKDDYIMAMLDPLWVVNEEDIIIDVNPAFQRLFGHQRENVLGASIYDFFDEKNAGILRSQMREKKDNGISSICEISIIARDTSQVPVLISSSPIYSGGEIRGKIGILKDFREHVKLREELRNSRDYIESVIDGIEEKIIVIDKEYRITKTNRIALLDSFTPVVGEFCYKVSHGSDRPCWSEGSECPAQIVFVTGKNYRTIHQHQDFLGKERYYEIIASPVRDAGGNVVHVIELLRDITDTIRYEDELNQKNRELLALNSISGLLNQSLNPAEIFSGVLGKMIEMIGIDGGGIFLIDDSTREMHCRYHKGLPDEYVKMLGNIRLGEDIPGKVAATGQIMTTSDISKDSRIESSVFRYSGIRGYSCIPIKGKERVIGVFCLFSFKNHLFTSGEESILGSIAEMTGIALENIKLYEKMRELYEFQRRRREDEHARLLSLSASLGAATDIQEIMGDVLGLIKSFFRADFVRLFANDEAGRFVLNYSTESLQRDKAMLCQSLVNSVEKFAMDEKKPFAVSDIQTEMEFDFGPQIAAKHYKATIAVPMYIGEKPVGVFSLYYGRSRIFRDEELHFLEIIGNILAVSLERADYYARTIHEKELSATILQSVTDGIITVNTSGKILSVNKSFERIVGPLPENTIGLPVCNIFRLNEGNEHFRFRFGECFEAALDGTAIKREAELATAYGNMVPILISSSPIQSMDGEVTGVVNLLRNISREKEIDRMKTEIVRSVSHEFRTPLSAIVGMTEMLLNRDIEEEKVRQYLTIIKSEGERLSKMISELLSIARIETGKESLKLSSFDIKALIRVTLESFKAQIESKEADIRYQADGPVYVVGDEDKIMQILFNILDNSLSFSDNKCVIEIGVHRKHFFLELIISDNGWGIPEEDLPHSVERFYRGKHGAKIKGTGLGLSLCDEIIKMHGGRMQIMSKEGEGTSIILDIPYREAQ